MRFVALCLVLFMAIALPSAEQPAPPAVDSLHKPFDELLDLYVRDGLVYYAAVKSLRGKLDGYIRTLDGSAAAGYANWPREQQMAFWINAYNAFVMRTVIDHYPIRGKASEYPRESIRQIPGAFERTTFRAAGRTLTLDAIEKEMLEPFGDPRVFLALGRGAVGGGRLRSEAYTSGRLEAQLTDAAAESMNRRELAEVDEVTGTLSVSPLFSWREAAFVTAYADRAPAAFAARSPLERAVLALISPYVLTSEREYLERNAFKMEFHAFDWRLNDLTGGRPDGRH